MTIIIIIIIIIIILSYYPLPLWGFSGIIKQIIEMEHNIFKNLTQLVGDKRVGYFTSVAEDLNWKLPKTNPASGLVQRFNRSATFLRQSVFPL